MLKGSVLLDGFTDIIELKCFVEVVNDHRRLHEKLRIHTKWKLAARSPYNKSKTCQLRVSVRCQQLGLTRRYLLS